jgi:hypothetical protein
LSQTAEDIPANFHAQIARRRAGMNVNLSRSNARFRE